MAGIIRQTVAKIKSDIRAWIEPAWIEQACEDAHYTWRQRDLDPVVTVGLFMLQVLHGNVAIRALRHLADMATTSGAYCKARARLPVKVLHILCSRWIASLRQATDTVGRWHGHRVFMLDGSGVSMPDAPTLQTRFGQPAAMKPGCGFPMMHVLVLFDAATGMIADLIADRHNRHDMADASKLHGALRSNDVLVGDRAFCTFAHFALVLQAAIHLVARLHQRRNVDFTPGRPSRRQSRKSQRKGRPSSRHIRRLGHDDQLVEYHKPGRRPDWMTAEQFAALPDTIVVRELRYRIDQPGYRTQQVTLVTTLTDPEKYPRHELATLYHRRWSAELNLRHLKTTMRMDVLRCKSVDGVMKELWMYVMIYNLVRAAMLDAARRQGVDPDRISFIDALDALRHGKADGAGPPLLANPDRPGRHQPRVIKRRKDRYRYMTRPRHDLLAQIGAVSALAP